MKKIALLADSWNRIVTADWIAGINEYNKTASEKVALYHFNSMGNWSKDSDYNMGEYNIFNLESLEQYDGIIIDVNNIHEKKHLEHVLDLVRNSHVPTISLGHYVEDLYYVGTDNAGAICEMMEHVRNMHRCRTFMFIGGPETNHENQMRLKAYLDTLQKWGLSVEDNPYFLDSFEMVSGEIAFRKILEKKLPIPDAFICANDNLAVGLMDEAQSHGYIIPRDFCVTGFDNVDKAYCYEPQVTTVSHQRVKMGKTCLRILHDIWDGKEVEKKCLLEPDISYTESCGCPLGTKVDFRKYVKEEIVLREKQRVYEEQLTELSSRLSKIVSFEEVFKEIGLFFKTLDCDGVTIVMDKRMQDLRDVEIFPIEGYSRENLMVVYDESIQSPDDYIAYDQFWAEKRNKEMDSIFMHSPIHFSNYSVGFMVVKNAKFLYDNPCFCDVQNLFIRTLFEHYQKERLKKANKQLDELYKRDALTGLYNRMAYFKSMEPILSLTRQANQYCLIAFFDCDNFKEINDTLGHNEGDRVLMKVGQILMNACTKEGAAFRFGGDEFVIANPCSTEDEAIAICDRVIKDFEKASIGISIGRVIARPDEEKDVNDYIAIADQDMYEHKRQKKGK